MRIIALLILSLTLCAEDIKLPPDAQSAIDKADKATAVVQSKADVEIGKIRKDLIASLTKSQEAVTRKGDLNTALAIKAKIDAIVKLIPSVDLMNDLQIDPSKFRSYGVKAWEALPGESKLISTAEIGPFTLEAGEEAIIVPHPADTWAAGATYPAVPYTGMGQPYGTMPWMCLEWVLHKDGQNLTGAVDPTKTIVGPCTFSLRPNDGNLLDNTGGIHVKVIIQKKR